MTAIEKHFLDLIAFAEGTSTASYTKNDGYDVIVMGADGHPEVLTDYSEHPFNHRPPKLVLKPSQTHPNGVKSSASGRYQIIIGTWIGLAKKLGLADFSPACQDEAGLELMRSLGIVAALEEGAVSKAINLAGDIRGWASFPSSTAQQGGKSMAALLKKWSELNA